MFKLFIRNYQLALKGNKFYVVALTISSILIAVLDLSVLFVVARLINTLIEYIQTKNGDLVNYIWILFGITVARWIIANILLQFIDYIGDIYKPKIIDFIDNEISSKLDKLSTEVIEDSEFQNQVSNIHTFSKSKFIENINLGSVLIQSFSKFSYAFIVLLFNNYLVALLIVLVSIPEVKYNLKIVKKLRQSNEELALERRKKNYFISLTQDISNYFNLKSYNLFPFFLNKVKQSQGVINNRVKDIQKYHKPRSVFIGTVANLLGQFIPKGYYVWATINSKISIGEFQLYFRYVDELYNSTYHFYNAYLQINENNIYVKDLFDFLDLKEGEISRVDKLDNLKSIDLEFRNVSFVYPESDKKVLNNINFIVKAGEKIAIVGENGAGKTTISKLINRFYEPTLGEILVNGKNVKSIDAQVWRNCISNLSQDIPKYFLTVSESILIGDHSNKFDTDKFNSSVELAQLEKDINKLPENSDTILGKYFPKGVNLSGGQWQKLAIARSFYRNSSLLILDEPTSAIDSETEQTIFKNIFDKKLSQTQIIISHKFSNIKLADKIIVLKNGEIIEQGDHKDLIERNGEYARLYNLQMSSFN